MSKTTSHVDMLWQQLVEYVQAWNKEAQRQEIDNVYKLFIEDGKEPLKAGGTIIKHYKTLKLVVDSNGESYLLYVAHSPLKDMMEASRSDNWKLQLIRDLMYQMFTNYTVMAHASIIQKERGKQEAKKQIGSMVDLSGNPLMK